MVSGQLKAIFASPKIIVDVWRNLHRQNPKYHESDLHDAMRNLGAIWETLFPEERKRMTQLLIERVVVKSEGIDIEYRADGLESVIDDLQQKLGTIVERKSV